jgi:hypothetical protein
MEFYNTQLCHFISVTAQLTVHNQHLILLDTNSFRVNRVKPNGIQTTTKLRTCFPVLQTKTLLVSSLVFTGQLGDYIDKTETAWTRDARGE